MPWSETDPNVEPSHRLDAEIAAAAKALFFAADLIRPGPGLLPFGAKARGRRERRHQVDTIAATRRAELGRLLATRQSSRIEPSTGVARRGHPQLVAAALGALVIAVAVAGWLIPLTTTTGLPPLEADTGSTATDLPLNEPDPTAPGPAGASTSPLDPGVDLRTPEAAAASWLAAWCSADATRDSDAVAAGIRAVMAADGWAEFTATPGQLLVGSAAGTTASCDTPTARIVARPAGSDDTVVVLVSATRTITEPDADSDAENAEAAAGFRIERLQYVVRGDDGVWRVDVAAVGG